MKYFCLDVGPRYWEDGTVNGEDDIAYEIQETGERPKMPLAVPVEHPSRKSDSWRWKLKIDVNNGHVQDWPQGYSADIHYKVCDDGTYWLEDENGNKYHEIDSYVPKILDFYHDSFGDYILMTINGEGYIEEWYGEDKLRGELEGFFMTEGF